MLYTTIKPEICTKWFQSSRTQSRLPLQPLGYVKCKIIKLKIEEFEKEKPVDSIFVPFSINRANDFIELLLIHKKFYKQNHSIYLNNDSEKP